MPAEDNDVIAPMPERITEAAKEFGIDPDRLRAAVLIYDRTLMGDSLAVERGIAAVIRDDAQKAWDVVDGQRDTMQTQLAEVERLRKQMLDRFIILRAEANDTNEPLALIVQTLDSWIKDLMDHEN